jgi:capsular exopolysaccharide synthesis family protein
MPGNNSTVDTLRSQLISMNDNEQDRPNAKETAMKYVAYIPWFIMFLLLFVGITLVYLRYKVPVYNNSIKILVKDDSKKSGSDLSSQLLSQLVLNGKSNLANEVEIVRSRSIMEKVVRNLGLNTLYYSKGNVREEEVYDTSKNKSIIFNEVKDSSHTYKVEIQIANNKIFYIEDANKKEIANNSKIQTKDFSFSVHIDYFSKYNSKYKYYAVWYSPSEMAKSISDKLVAEPLNKDASIIQLSYQTTLPAKGRDILNNLAVEYVNANIQDKNEMIDNTIRFVDERLLLISGQLGGVENQLQNFKENNVVIDSGRQQIALERTKDIMAEMDQLEVKLSVTDMVSQYVNDPARKFSLVPSTLGIDDVTLLDLIRTYNEGVMQREELLKTLPEGNIAVSTIEDQLEQLQPKIVENVNNIKKSYSSAYTIAKAKYDDIIQTMGTIPQKQKELLEIERQQGIKENLYLYLLEKREESAVNRASAVGNSSPIDPAITDDVPVEPKTLLLYIASVLLGIAFPLLFIYLRDVFNDKIITKADILKYTKTPIAGEISHGRGKQKIIDYKSRNVLAEQFRIIRTNLQYFSLKEKASNTIMITSSMSNEGKTFFSMNFGATLSLTGKKVVLVEFDLRKPKISRTLVLENKNIGITNYLSGDSSVADNIVPVEGIDNYFLLPCGPMAPNPAELLLNPKIDSLFLYLKEHFDYIIIDCPPIGLVSDPKVITKYSDINFYLVRQRYTFKKQLKFVNELYEQQLLKNMVLIINDVVTTGTSGYYGYTNSYGYGYSQGYNYNYNYGYDSEEKITWWKKLFKK